MDIQLFIKKEMSPTQSALLKLEKKFKFDYKMEQQNATVKSIQRTIGRKLIGNEPIRFEEAMLKLEEVVQKLETGDVPLEDAITLYKKGMELSAYCHGKLQDAEKQLFRLLIKMEIKQPFDPAKGADTNE